MFRERKTWALFVASIVAVAFTLTALNFPALNTFNTAEADAQSLVAKKTNFMIRTVQAAQELQAVRVKLAGLRNEWDANGYSGTITQNDIASASIQHLTPTILANVFVSQGNLETWSGGTGNWTNINLATGN